MQLIIKNLTAKEIELANFMLARGIEVFEDESKSLEWKISQKDVEKAKTFRTKLLNAFLKKD